MCNPRSRSFSSVSSVLVWLGENDTKTLVQWMKIFCFVFAAMKTDTFENALVPFSYKKVLPLRTEAHFLFERAAGIQHLCVLLDGYKGCDIS